MRCLLFVPRISGVSTRAAFRPQLPLGHILIGSNLLRRGHDVALLDADVLRLSQTASIRQIEHNRPDCLLVGHPASTVAHPATMRLTAAIRQRMPALKIIYGGLYPTYHAAEIMQTGNVDYIVTHEAEEVTANLVERLSSTPKPLAIRPASCVASR